MAEASSDPLGADYGSDSALQSQQRSVAIPITGITELETTGAQPGVAATLAGAQARGGIVRPALGLPPYLSFDEVKR